jgi:hypothetical protein
VKEYIVSATREAKTTTAGTTTSSGSTGTTETASGNEDQTGNDDDGTDNGVALYGDRNIYYSNTPWLIFMVGFLAAVGVVLTILLVVPNRKRRRRHLRRDKPKHYE